MALEESNFLPENYGIFTGGVLCLNSKYRQVLPKTESIFVLSFWTLSLICLCGGYLLNYWLHDLRLSYWISSIIALLYHEFKKLFHKLKCSQTGCGKNRVAKLLPIDDENLMATINVANCQIHIRKVKINEKKTISFRITITHKTLRWHIWRTFSEFESAQKQLKIDFPTLPIMALITPLSRRPYNAPETVSEETTKVLTHQQITLTEWIYALVDVHIICNHIEIRRLLGLPKYAHSNRYGSLYLPPYALAKVRQAHQDRKKRDETVSAQRTFSDSSVDLNDHTNLNSLPMPQTNDVVKKKKRHAPKVLSRVISGVSKSTKPDIPHEIPIPAPAPTPPPAPSSPPAPPIKIDNNLIGTNWMDAEFLDQTDAERSMYRDLRMGHKFMVRGKNYARDGKKILTGPAIFRLVVMDVYEVETGTRHDHIASMGRAKQRIDALNSLPEPPLLFVMNFQIPGDPPVSIMSIFAASPSLAEVSPNDTEDTACYKRMWQSYYNNTFESEADRLDSWGLDDSNGNDGLNSPQQEVGGGPKSTWKLPSDITWGSPKEPGVYPITDFKNMRFKLIPTVTEGNWMVRSAVPSAKPALLGQKLQQRYFRGKNYIETDVDVGSSVIASQIVGVLRGYGKHFACDVGVVLQGECEAELPERMLACIVINKVDVDLRKKLYNPSPPETPVETIG